VKLEQSVFSRAVKRCSLYKTQLLCQTQNFILILFKPKFCNSFETLSVPFVILLELVSIWHFCIISLRLYFKRKCYVW